MKAAAALRWLVVWGVGAGCIGGASGPIRAEERAREFLEGLRDQGLYDEAIQHLDKARTDPSVSAEFKEVIDHEAGITLMHASLATEDPALRQKRLGLAEKRFKKFLEEHPDHALAGSAAMQRGNTLVEFGRMQAEKARRPSTGAEEKARLMAEARAKYAEAQKVFTAAEKRFSEEHKKFPKIIDPQQTEMIESRYEVRKNLVQARLLLPTVIWEIGQTYRPGSAEHKKHLTDAANGYAALYRKYKMFLAGLYARIWQGRCLKDLGDVKGALAIFDELLLQPDEPKAFRDFKARTVVLALETCLLPEAKRYKEALARAEAWLESARADEETSPDGLAIRYRAGTAALELAGPLAENDPQRREYQRTARRHLDFVSRFAGEYQQKAKQRLDKDILPGPDGERR